MLFIVPILLINGNEGLGSGHAQKILPRNIHEVINYIRTYLSGDSSPLPILIPFYNGFTGTIEQREEQNQWKISGIVNRPSKTKTEIIEVPINEDYVSYIKKLDALVDSKIINSYEDLCDTREDKFHFIIKHADFSNLSNEQLLDKLKLIYNVSENYTVIDEENKLITFNTIYELLTHYINVRLEYYSLRKQYIISLMEKDLQILRNKVKFIKDVNQSKIDIHNKRKVELEEDLSSLSYDLFENSYEYLLGMKIYSLTLEKQEEFEKETVALEKKLTDYKIKSEKDIWLDELEELEKNIPPQSRKGTKKETKTKPKTEEPIQKAQPKLKMLKITKQEEEPLPKDIQNLF